MAQKIHSLGRQKIVIGRPQFPYLDQSGDNIKLPELSSLVTAESWLIFDVLGLSGPQDLLTIPEKMWGPICRVEEIQGEL